MLYIAGIDPESVVDGEGWRYVVFVQGCKHACKNCHNPQTWEMNTGETFEVSELVSDIKASLEANILIDGVTISGGDPFYQAKEVAELCKQLHELDINIWAYTGFLYEQIIQDEQMRNILKYIDVLVDGPFIESKKTLDINYIGSTNQRIIDVQKTLVDNKVVLYVTE